MPVPVVAGNWKMNTTVEEAYSLASAMRDGLERVAGVEKVICPPFVSLGRVQEALKGTSVKLGAQNMHAEEKGAFTGEVSPVMLKGLCEYVILGHSERRQHFGETDELVNRKVKAALRFGLRPIVCVGETFEQRETGRAETVVLAQLEHALNDVGQGLGSIAIAYEPVWAIGTGRAATLEVVDAMMALARQRLVSIYGDGGRGVPLLYGGSVIPENIASFVTGKNVDGALVGGASLKPKDFVEIVARTAEAKCR